MIDPSISNLIHEEIERYASGSEPDSLKLRDAASQLKALPLICDAGGCFLVRPSGDVISFAWGSVEEWSVEVDERIRNLALFQGSRNYSWLHALIPSRGEAAPVCPVCGGSGTDPASEKLSLSNVVCYGGGLGWIPENDSAAR